jgi:hypothetical protein
MRAIAYFSNGLGNFVQMMPYLAGLATMTDIGMVDICLDGNWTDCRKPAVRDVCEAWSVVQNVFDWPHSKFNPRDYGLWFFSAHGNNGNEAVHHFLGHLTRETLRIRPSWRKSGWHETDHYNDVLTALGFEGELPRVEFPTANDPLIDELPRPRIGLCNGWFRSARHDWDKKGWPHFGRFSALAGRFFGGSMVGLGLSGELPKDTPLSRDFTGKLSILQTAKVISQLDLLVTTDTGLMHVADIMEIPMIALFGPTLLTKNRPLGKNSTVLVTSSECAPCQDLCTFDECRSYVCMASIAPVDVLTLARRKLEGGDRG